LKRAQLITIPGSAFGEAGEGFVRVCFAVGESVIKEAISRLESILENFPPDNFSEENCNKSRKKKCL
jgi:aminotransferase